jgi:two-component system chemotaxis sensor kinase CheA
MNDEMEEIISEFITESEESLDKVEPLFVELEQKGQDDNILNEIFRSMHTIKGAAGFLNFQTIVDVSHSAENIMKKLRESKVTLSVNIMNVLLKAIDMLRLLLTHLKSKDGIEENVSPLVKEMDNALKSASGVSDSPDMSDQEQKHKEPVEIEKLIKSYSETTHDTVSTENNTTGTGQETQSKELNEVKENHQKNEVHGQKLKDISSNNLRVDIERIDNVMNLAGEVVLVRNRLLNISAYLEQKYGSDNQVETLMESVSFLDRVTSDMQLAVMKIRMQPIKKVLTKFPRLVRDISNSVNKDVELEIIGDDTEVDKTVIENIGDPLTHILRKDSY